LKNDLTQERLKELLYYNAATGIFYWRRTDCGRRSKPAGRLAVNGYIGISIDYKRYYAHRLAFLYIRGRWPDGDIDHINGRRSDNRLWNLREATRAQNLMNSKRRRDNTSGFRGVYPRHGKYQARFRNKCLGVFLTAEEASAAHSKAARELFGEFA
jgi:hypothetical protein